MCESCVWVSTARQTASVGFSRRTGPVFYPRLFALSVHKHMLVAKSFSVGSLAGIKELVDINAKRKCTGITIVKPPSSIAVTVDRNKKALLEATAIDCKSNINTTKRCDMYYI